MIKALKRAHPFVVFTYFLGLFLLAPFSRHPWMTGVQMICLCLLYFYHNRSLEKVFSIHSFDCHRGCNESVICTKRKNNPVCRHTHKDHERSTALWNSLWMCVSESLTGLFDL